MEIYIVDGTYELFRAHFGYPSRKTERGKEVGALKGYINHLQSLKKNYEYLGVAFDSEVESFRNEIFKDYKSSKDIDKDILGQFSLAEKATELLGITLLSMDQYEADDAIASVCSVFKNKNIKIIIGSLDKDLMQCLSNENVVMYSTRYKTFTEKQDVYKKFGVYPNQIPDFLALVGDSSDGIPGMKGIGEKTAALLLQKYENIENIYKNISEWKSIFRGGERHSNTIYNNYELLKLFKDLTTLRRDVVVPNNIKDYSLSEINKSNLSKFSDRYQLNINF
jgi:5'-3' exonuclease